VGAGAEEIIQASDDLPCRNEQQAASLEETAATRDEIKAPARRPAEGTNKARKIVITAKIKRHSTRITGVLMLRAPP